MTRIYLTTVLLLTLGSAPAFSQHHEMAMPGMDHAADNDMRSSMDRMNHDMASAPMTGDPDHDFVAMMIPHHQGAVDMAKAELRSGKDQTMRRFAADIIAAQEKEIALMRRWQAAHPAH